MKTVFKLSAKIINPDTASIVLEGMMKEEYSSYEEAEKNIEEKCILILDDVSKNQIEKPKNICYMQVVKFYKYDSLSENKS